MREVSLHMEVTSYINGESCLPTPPWCVEVSMEVNSHIDKQTILANSHELDGECMALTKSLSFSLRRKRVLISDNNLIKDQFCLITPMKKKLRSPEIHHHYHQCSSSLLEDLPQELLIKVVCGVDHDDLKQLFLVSKTVRDSAIIAKNSHFAYSTPSKTKAFRNSVEMLKNMENFDEIPNAPKQAHRKLKRRRFDRKMLGNVAVPLFSDEDVVQSWPRRSLFMDIDS